MGVGIRTPLRVKKRNLKWPAWKQTAGAEEKSTMKYNRKRQSNWSSKGAAQLVKVKQFEVYEPPRLQDLKWQNRVKTRRHQMWRNPPHAPRNTSTYILQSKKAGALDFVSPAVTSSTLPASSPLPMYKDGVVEEVKQWVVDDYGSMTNLIRLRSFDDDELTGAVSFDGAASGHGARSLGDGSLQSSMEGVEQRLEQDLVRFELTYPPNPSEEEDHATLQRKVEYQEQQIATLEDENLTLRERVYLLQREMSELRQRLGYSSARLDVPDDAYSELVDPLSNAA